MICQDGRMTGQVGYRFKLNRVYTLVMVWTLTNMGFLVHRGFLLLLCIGYLSFQPEKVSSLTSIDLALRLKQELLPVAQNSRMLTTVALDDLQTFTSSAPAPSMVFDPNQSNKRTVRKGSDPIHNRC
ncbi:conserved hypothetical protein [Ricinus communis]|uniref:Uncharacterized protein n=1 Tax=Ricinus communis TaxID=3988 RepID=B9RLZ0_RICCO|nr:conserved hypothetical protein [Ricinus communis]